MPLRRAYRPSAPSVAEVAAGAIVRHHPSGDVLLLHYRKEDRWCFAKGHVELGESLRATARREVAEETGLASVHLGRELITVSYRFYNPKRALNVLKTTVYFAGSTRSRDVHPEPLFDAFAWTTPAEAMRRLPYENDRDALRAALAADRGRRRTGARRTRAPNRT